MLLMLVTSTSAPTVLAVKFHENLHAKINCFFYVSVRKVSRKFGFKEVSDDMFLRFSSEGVS